MSRSGRGFDCVSLNNLPSLIRRPHTLPRYGGPVMGWGGHCVFGGTGGAERLGDGLAQKHMRRGC
jgi:hypothetical protein